MKLANKSPGRLPGKSADPEFTQITTYIRKETHRNVKIELLKEGKDRELSELVEDLLSSWLKRRS
jgi:hypothetical protein